MHCKTALQFSCTTNIAESLRCDASAIPNNSFHNVIVRILSAMPVLHQTYVI